MKKSSFSISNEFDIEVGLEPIGNVFLLKPKDFIEVIMESEVEKSVDVQVHSGDRGVFISLWPENGDYQVLYNGNEMI